MYEVESDLMDCKICFYEKKSFAFGMRNSINTVSQN